ISFGPCQSPPGPGRLRQRTLQRLKQVRKVARASRPCVTSTPAGTGTSLTDLFKMPAFTGHRRHHAGGRLISAVLILFCAVAAHAQLDEVVATVDRTLITRMDLRFHVLERRLYNPELWSVPVELIEKQVLTDAVHEQLLYRDL